MLVSYVMKPKTGYDYLATAARFAAEASTATHEPALVYFINPDKEERKQL